MYTDLENFMRKISSRDYLGRRIVKIATLAKLITDVIGAARRGMDAVDPKMFDDIPKLLKENPDEIESIYRNLPVRDQRAFSDAVESKFTGGADAFNKLVKQSKEYRDQAVEIKTLIDDNPEAALARFKDGDFRGLEEVWSHHPDDAVRNMNIEDYIKGKAREAGIDVDGASSAARGPDTSAPTSPTDASPGLSPRPPTRNVLNDSEEFRMLSLVETDSVDTIVTQIANRPLGDLEKEMIRRLPAEKRSDILKSLRENQGRAPNIESVLDEADSLNLREVDVGSASTRAPDPDAPGTRPTDTPVVRRFRRAQITSASSTDEIIEQIKGRRPGDIFDDEKAVIESLPDADKARVLEEISRTTAVVNEASNPSSKLHGIFKGFGDKVKDIWGRGYPYAKEKLGNLADVIRNNPKISAAIAAGTLSGIGLWFALHGNDADANTEVPLPPTDTGGGGGSTGGGSTGGGDTGGGGGSTGGSSGGGGGSTGGDSGGSGGGAADKKTGAPTAADYEYVSGIMKEKGYLSTIHSSWTSEFNAAFNAYVDTGTANNRNLKKTNLVGGEKWSDVAPGLGFSPDEAGGIQAIKSLARFVPAKSSGSGGGGGGDRRGDTGGEKPIAGKQSVLAEILSLLYHDRLAEGGGFLSKEKKQTQSLVDAAGGATSSGYNNAARILLGRNPSLNSFLPERLEGPITKKNVKSLAVFPAIQQTQKTIHELFEAANPGTINPGQAKATENIISYLGTPPGGNWKRGSNKSDRLVKLAERRKERIMAEVAAELTPAERAALRIFKMRGV